VSMQTVWIVIVLASLALPHPGNAQGRSVGKNDFEKFCAECHGMSGKGDGPRAKTLEKRPADLTKLAERNGGVFPVVHVYGVIDGRVEVWVHGRRDMPVWGDIYTRELHARSPREFPPEVIDGLVRARILEMIEYLLTLQEK
jgi:mono/diheme cytochrome c family protein